MEASDSRGFRHPLESGDSMLCLNISTRGQLRQESAGISATVLQDRVFCRGEQEAGTAGLAPYTVVDAAGLSTNEVAGMNFLVVNHQFAFKQIQLFDACVLVGRIVGSGSEPDDHGYAIRLGI